MPDAILYYRTTSTFKGASSSATYWNPDDLPSNQKLVFSFSDNMLEGIDFQYQNNVLDISAPNADGTRRINKQDNGLKMCSLTINGVFKIPISSNLPALDTDIYALKTMASMSQVDTYHPFGKIGFYSPNAPEFSLDPNAQSSSTVATRGFTLSSLRIGYIGQKTTRYGFSVTLNFGGTFTQDSIGGT
jgi:hypothetical protein